MRAVLDTNVLVAALRSRDGASAALLRHAASAKFEMVVSVPLYVEYEAILTHPAHLAAAGASTEDVLRFLATLGTLMKPVKLHYQWRPQLNNVADEMVLDTAINGRADVITTFNSRHFSAAIRFGIEAILPRDALKRLS